MILDKLKTIKLSRMTPEYIDFFSIISNVIKSKETENEIIWSIGNKVYFHYDIKHNRLYVENGLYVNTKLSDVLYLSKWFFDIENPMVTFLGKNTFYTETYYDR